VEIPPVGGDTLFADMYAAYDGLSEAVKARIDGRVAIHDFTHFRKAMRRRGKTEAEIAALDAAFPKPRHPVVRTHPETGRKALYAQAAIPDYHGRFRWEPNSIAFWDNRASQHYAASDYWPAVRRMERVTIVGDRPR
jgi:taurine dioxygenase